MNTNSWLKESTAALDKCSDTPRLDAEVLLCHVLSKDRAWLLAHPDHMLQGGSLRKLEELLKRRVKAEPIAYILGKCEFYGREFLVDKNVLVPRPESEAIIDLLKNLPHHNSPNNKDTPCWLVDVGTGSGALAITSKLELPHAKVLAIDIDPKCIENARKNAKKHKVDVEFIVSDLLSQLPTSNYRLLTILANLPYVPDGYEINEAAKHEPKLALFGGTDGLDLYRKLFMQLTDVGANVFTESLTFQHEELAKIACSAGFKQTNEQDLVQVFDKS